ncbi:cysteine-rich receptor-like protein kinase [Tanacetum coccineum]|uniref:Cysteine-rich receptor-like protein kinase n=1 Tax=Tanacetum coccineum TaxID=301880 RepID=A0ABQ5G413_9ASTR
MDVMIPDFESIVGYLWGKAVFSRNPDAIFRDKLKIVKEGLRSWSKQRFGSNDIDVDFFKDEDCWGVIKVDLLKALEWFWETCSISKGCNPSFVTLIPKTQNPIGLSDYMPISLIGCFYKILAERIKKVIGGLIGDEQNAFIKGRFILDGSLIANEAFDFLKKKKKRAFLLKIDFEKAYDSVNWKFITDTMGQIGFGDKWCKWVEVCLNSATVLVLVNGSPTNEFIMERGVRQGDPLSPFLFLVAAEGLNVTLNEAVSKGIFKGVKIGHDDIPTKIYGGGVRNDEIERLANRIGVSPGSLPFTYLGLPIGVNMKKMVCWNGIVEKVKKKLAGWKSKMISYGGRLTLVK